MSWDRDTCDGTVSFPDLGRAPYNGSTPVMMYGPDCGDPLPPELPAKPPPPPPHNNVGDFPRVAVALPATNGADPYLTDWRRPAGDPVTFDGVPCSFPGRVWKSTQGPYWNMLCAYGGRTPWARYTTTDPSLLRWRVADPDFAVDPSRNCSAAGSCSTPDVGAGALFHPIPNAAPGGPTHMINANHGTAFALGNYSATTEKMVLLSKGTGSLATPAVLDYGPFYKWAATGMAADGRLLAIAWVDEFECAEDSPPGPGAACNGMRHRSVLSLVRQIVWDRAAAQLVSRPVAELDRLHNATFLDGERRAVPAGTSAAPLGEIPAQAGGALDLRVSFDTAGWPASGPGPRGFGVAVEAASGSVANATVLLLFSASAPGTDGSRTVAVTNAGVLRPPPPPPHLSRVMNDTDLPAADYNISHHPPGAIAAGCQARCDADPRCAAWVWVLRGLPAGAHDCCLKRAGFVCPAHVPPPHPCEPGGCRLVAGVKVTGACNLPPPPPIAFNVTVLHGETLDARLLVDRPIVEVFVNGGRGAFVAAANFSLDRATAHLVNRGVHPVAATVSAHGMGCGWSAELPVPRVLPRQPAGP